MNRYLLLILLSSWAHVVPLSLQCETGVANPNSILSVPRSLMANADVALIKTYQAETVDKCITDCCTEKFGSCSVASFKKDNASEENCQHFNCRPIIKCKFLSSNSTDSFSFSSSSSPHILVPSSHASKNDSLSSTVATLTTNKPKLDTIVHNEQHGVTKEAVDTFSVEQFALKNDNTTVKPRKGVDDVTEDSFENVSRSGVKPRKGVILDGITTSNNTKSKVKPRKGVGPYQSHSVSSSAEIVETSTYHTVSNLKSEHYSTPSSASNKDILADDVVSALEKVFEDDTKEKDIEPSVTSSTKSTVKALQTSATVTHSFIPTIASSMHTTSSVEKATPSIIQSSIATNYVVSSSAQTPDLVTASQATGTVSKYSMPSSTSPSILEHSKLLFREFTVDDDTKPLESEESENSAESENERKYRSSMRLVLSLVFGLLVLFSVLGVIAKRVYDGWMRRHYRRMDFLIDGMYNGYG